MNEMIAEGSRSQMAEQSNGVMERTTDNRATIAFMQSPVAKSVQPLDLEVVREKLAQSNGSEYWRSLEELAETPGFHEMLQKEFPGQAPASWSALGRRDFMKLMGAALALAGLTGCARQPQEKIIPFVQSPENMVLGKPQFFATAYPLRGYAMGVLAESNSGRPTKIEGNPDHPVTRGATDVWMQASVLELWDPDRSQNVMNEGRISTWENFTGAMQTVRQNLAANRGAGFHILTGRTTSPTLAAQIADLRRRLPEATLHVWESAGTENIREGSRIAFGRELDPVYNFTDAEIVVTLDHDFILEDPNHLTYSREFINGRRVRATNGSMNRLYAVESSHTVTGAKADHRLPLRASRIEAFTRALAGALGVPGMSAVLPQSNEGVDAEKYMAAMVSDLQGARGRSLVVAGMNQPPVVHAIAHAINNALGNIGATVSFRAPIDILPTNSAGTTPLRSLATALKAKNVKTLLVIDANPVYDAPADLDFAKAVENVPTRIHLGNYYDETGQWSQWHIPMAHYLESWSDARAYDGTVSLIQPLIAPLYQSRTAHELISVFQGGFQSSYEIVKSYWRTQPQARTAPGGDFEKFWQTALHDGIVANTRVTASSVRPNISAVPAASATAEQGIEIMFRPDPTVWDGRYANNGWLQELPKPLTKLTWENTAQLSPATAQRLGVTNEDIVTIKYDGRQVNAPVWVVAGHADDAVTLHLGYGRELGGQIAKGTGFNAGALRTSTAPWFGQGAEITKTGDRTLLACTQPHHNLHGRNHVRESSLDNFKQNPTFVNDYESEFHVGPHAEHGGAHDPAGDHGPGSEDASNHEDAAGAKPGRNLSHNGGAPAGAHGGKEDTHADFAGNSPATGKGKEAPRYKDYIKQDNISPMHTEAVGRPPVAGYKPGEYERNKQSDGSTVTGEPSNPSHPTLYQQWKYEGYAWGMAIDLTACVGCNACVIGCQSENNIATVGKDEVLRGREMHWIRIDTYYRGPIENPEATFQPMTCQHCENAPCEPVCPVEATSHSAEGINEMTYNRCIGTRYCSNNCPYKVRRFNFLQYSEQDTPQIMLMHNPEVTVRARGVMEKCTYCVQRVNLARIEVEKENTNLAANQPKRRLQDGDVVTACQQACPTDAIIFGDLNDPNSRVSKLKKNPLNYGVLTELNTQPRTTYLAKLQNPNTALKTGKVLPDTPETSWEKSA
jgi:molybdopterin-containing oxidoreductase family iron-sulfur binding subunit